MKKKRVHSVIPVYAAALWWVLWALILPLFRLHHIWLCASGGFFVWLIADAIFKGETVEVEPEPPSDENDPERVLSWCEAARDVFGSLAGEIADSRVSQCCTRLAELTDKILGKLREDSSALPSVHRFTSFVLPSAVKLMTTYRKAEQQGISGQNILEIKSETENACGPLEEAFEKTLDSLYSREAFDISTDIAVIEKLIAAEERTAK